MVLLLQALDAEGARKSHLFRGRSLRSHSASAGPAANDHVERCRTRSMRSIETDNEIIER